MDFSPESENTTLGPWKWAIVRWAFLRGRFCAGDIARDQQICLRKHPIALTTARLVVERLPSYVANYQHERATKLKTHLVMRTHFTSSGSSNIGLWWQLPVAVRDCILARPILQGNTLRVVVRNYSLSG